MKSLKDFTFETVASTTRNLELLKISKSAGYFIRCIYVITDNPDINVARVSSRYLNGGHFVPENKVRERYNRAIDLVQNL